MVLWHFLSQLAGLTYILCQHPVNCLVVASEMPFVLWCFVSQLVGLTCIICQHPVNRLVQGKSVVQCACHHGRQRVVRCEEFTEDMRIQLLTEYNESADFYRQRDFI